MALPLPTPQPGGFTLGAMREANALSSDLYGNAIKNIQAQYAPLTTQAEAASKLAYANLMGPQFLAKIMGNQDILANLPADKRQQALDMVFRAGSGQSAGNNVLNQMGAPAPNQTNSPFSQIVNNVKDVMGFGDKKSSPVVNALAEQPNLSPTDKNAISNLQPGQAYTVQGNQPNALQPNNAGQNTFAENAGRFSGIKKEGEEAGKIRAKDIDELNNSVFNAQTNQTTLDTISGILSSPEFEKIRQTPILGHHELSYYSKFGTPEQQNMVGQYYTLTGNIIKDSARDFGGQFRKGEQQLLQGMKPAPGDTVDTARGKTESLAYMNKMLAERSRLTSQYMNQYHINKLQASEMADKEVNGDKIRQNIHNKLNPKPTDADIKFMAKKYGYSEDEVKKRLKAKGY
jgi:hypothetical protein